METTSEKTLRSRIRFLIIFFIISLILSGITAFAIESQLYIATKYIWIFPDMLQQWISTVYNAVKTTNSNFPFLSYGTDWLAFAHIVIAVAFWGPLKDPVRNIWVIQFGMIACILILPLALIAGPIRHIPFYWQLIDCSFGVIGFIPLLLCYKYTRRLEGLNCERVV